MTPLHFAQEYVGTIKVANLETGAEISVPVRDKGSDQFAARFKKVAKDRRKWARKNDISCYRIYDADLPDFAVAIDRYDGVWKSEGQSCLIVAEYQAPKTIDQAKAEARFEDAVAIASAVTGIPSGRVFAKRAVAKRAAASMSTSKKRATSCSRRRRAISSRWIWGATSTRASSSITA